MRVALVCGDFAPRRDGVADYVARLAAALPSYDVEPVVCTAGARPGAVEVTDRWRPGALPGVRRALRRLAPDLVHVQFAPSAYRFSPAVGLLPLVSPAPVVTTLHEYGWWTWPSRVPPVGWRAVERGGQWDRETLLLGPRSARLVVTNAAHAAVVLSRLGRVADLIPIGPNVDVAPGGPGAVRAELGVPVGAVLLAFFGFVHPVKGLRHLLDALPALRRRHPRLHLVVAGGFESLALPGREAVDFEAELRGQVARLGLDDAVTVTGWLPAATVSRLLAAADAAVLPFTAGVTTKSGSLLAALAHGLPVVATVADPPDPALVDGGSVVAVERVRDSGAIAHALDRLLGDDALRARIAAGGRRVADQQGWDRIAAAHADLYASVPGRVPAGA